MSPNVRDARELVIEGDRLLGRAWEQFPRSRTSLGPSDLAVAEHSYAEAARLYLAAAVEYQGTSEAIDVFEADPGDLVTTLNGQLRAEATAALADAERLLRDASDAAVERERAFAEGLRERFSHALPELFPVASNDAGRVIPEHANR